MEILNFIIINIVIYMPFHLFEEAIGDFPKWMFEHKWLPYHMTHGHWMANNIFVYYPMLLASALLYFFHNEWTCFGVAVLIWGLINFVDHFFYTIKDRKLSFGLITGILFLINSTFGLKTFIWSDAFSMFHFIMGIGLGGVLFGLPIGLCIVTYPFFEKYIK